MTRKKWLKLRRRRPELFSGFEMESWESMDPKTAAIMKKVSVGEAIRVMSNYRLEMREPVARFVRGLDGFGIGKL